MPLFYHSQQQNIDSLERLLPTATTDSTRYELFYNIASAYSYTHYDSALYYVNKALVFAQKNGKKLNEAAALSRKGYVLNRLQRLPESYQAITAALQIAEDPRNENSFWATSLPEVKDKDYRFITLAGIHNSLAIFLEFAGSTDEAIPRFKEAIRFYRAAGDYLSVAVMNANLGHLYLRNLNEPDSALLLERAAERIFLRNKEESRLGAVYGITGASYLAKHNESLGLANQYKAILFDKKYNTQNFLAATYRALAQFYLQKENKDSSLYYSRQAANIHITLYSMDLGDDFENLAKSYELNHQRDSAYKYKTIALATYNSLSKNRIKGLTGFQQLSFDQQQQLQQLKEEKIAAQNRTRRYSMLGGLGIAMLISFFLYRNSQQQKKANLLLQQQKNETEEQKLKAESALQQLKETQLQLIQSEKMASLGELTAGIAHEIQNPLNFVNNFSEVSTELVNEMEDALHQDDKEEAVAIASDIKDNLRKIHHHGKRADAIVKGMLEHSRTSKGEKQPTDINALADEYLRLSYHGLRAKDKDFNATIETQFDKSIGKVNVVPQDIGRVLLHLFNNAFYAVSARQKLEGESFKPIVKIQTKKVDSKIEVIVKDNGNGIPENVINKIFQPFFTTKPTGEGTGLGLSLSYDIIKAHGGEIKVQSKKGEGSTFSTVLPLNLN
jgi:signal transduction histidine kinase